MPTPHVLHTEGGDVRARAVVVSAGVKYRRLDAPGIERLVGLGVHYGSAMTAAREMEGADVIVVGGGNSAGQAAIHLARFARSVTILVRRESLAETMSSYLVGEIGYNPRITVQGCSEVTEGGPARTAGSAGSRCATLPTAPRTRRDCRGLFLLIGAAPHCDWLPDAVARDERGFVLTGRDVPQRPWRDGLPPESLETTVPGVFAAGDIRAGSMKRVRRAPAARAPRSCRSCTPGSTRRTDDRDGDEPSEADELAVAERVAVGRRRGGRQVGRVCRRGCGAGAASVGRVRTGRQTAETPAACACPAPGPRCRRRRRRRRRRLRRGRGAAWTEGRGSSCGAGCRVHVPTFASVLCGICPG